MIDLFYFLLDDDDYITRNSFIDIYHLSFECFYFYSFYFISIKTKKNALPIHNIDFLIAIDSLFFLFQQ